MPDLPDPKEGDPLDADFFKAIITWIRANAVKVMPGGGLRIQKSGGGEMLIVEKRPEFWAKLTTNSTGGAYVFTREIDAAAGVFTDDATMTGNATEVNLESTLPTGTIVWMTQGGATSTWRFSKGAC